MTSSDQITITLTREEANWLHGFFKTLIEPLKLENLNKDTMNARAVMTAVQEGFSREKTTN